MTRDEAHPGATCWVIKPLLRIDYAFLSAGLASADDAGDGEAPAGKLPAGGVRAAVRGYQRVEDDSSDHFPVVVDLALRFGGAAARDVDTN